MKRFPWEVLWVAFTVDILGSKLAEILPPLSLAMILSPRKRLYFMTLNKVYDVAETFEKASLWELIVHGKRIEDSTFTEEN